MSDRLDGRDAYSGGLVGAHEIAELLGGISRQRVSVLTTRGDFPAPVASLRSGRIWARSDVLTWALSHGRRVHTLDGPDALGGVPGMQGPPSPREGDGGPVVGV